MSKSKRMIVGGKLVDVSRKNVLIETLSSDLEKVKNMKVQSSIAKKAMRATTKELTGLIGEAKKEIKKQK